MQHKDIDNLKNYYQNKDATKQCRLNEEVLDILRDYCKTEKLNANRYILNALLNQMIKDKILTIE